MVAVQQPLSGGERRGAFLGFVQRDISKSTPAQRLRWLETSRPLPLLQKRSVLLDLGHPDNRNPKVREADSCFEPSWQRSPFWP